MVQWSYNPQKEWILQPQHCENIKIHLVVAAGCWLTQWGIDTNTSDNISNQVMKYMHNITDLSYFLYHSFTLSVHKF